MDCDYDVIVIGGGPAGLSGAIALARFRRSVLVIDAGDPRNATAGHVHNFLTRDGASPAELSAVGRAEFESYGGTFLQARVETVQGEIDRFRVDAGIRQVTARRLLVATGVRDELPDIPGVAQRWGRDVLHCPYCHGWEVRDRRIGVVATGPLAAHVALLFSQLSPDVVVLEHAAGVLSVDDREQLAGVGIALIDGPVAALELDDTDTLTGVRLSSGVVVGLDALVVAPRMYARDEALRPLGIAAGKVEVADRLIGTQIDADSSGLTAIPGVWVAGNLADVRAQVVSSAAAGLTAGAAINQDLITRDSARVTTGQEVTGPRFWDELYGSLDAVWSGLPNPALVREAGDLAPGRALDVGCGEGADALWLAERGWHVTALDVSQVALNRALSHAARSDVDVEWRLGGLLRAGLARRSFELVSAQYPALLRTPGRNAEHQLLDLVAPGGVLLFVHHANVDIEQAKDHGFDPEDYVQPGDLAALLDDNWVVEVNEIRPRNVATGAGAHHTHDHVLRLRRLAREASVFA